HRAWNLRYAAPGGAARCRAPVAGAAGAVSIASRPAAGVCGAGAPHLRKPDAQRRSDSPRRRDPHGTQVMLTALSGVLAGVFHVLSGPDHLAAVAPLAASGRGRSMRAGWTWGVG